MQRERFSIVLPAFDDEPGANPWSYFWVTYGVYS
jgi:hypothetical protein